MLISASNAFLSTHPPGWSKRVSRKIVSSGSGSGVDFLLTDCGCFERLLGAIRFIKKIQDNLIHFEVQEWCIYMTELFLETVGVNNGIPHVRFRDRLELELLKVEGSHDSWLYGQLISGLYG